MKNLKIKKIIAVMTALTSMMILAACGSSDVDSTASNQSDSNVEVTESITEEEQINDDAEEDGSRFIEVLTPTHTTAAEWPFEIQGSLNGSLFLPGQAISDLSTMTNGRYRIKPSLEYRKILGIDDDTYVDYSWEELKDLKVSCLYLSGGDYYFYIMCDEKGEKLSVASIYLRGDIDGIEDMTIEEAVEQGYWMYTDMYNNGMHWVDFFTTTSLEGEYKGLLNHIIDIWGMPSEVFYAEQLSSFALVYQTENCDIMIMAADMDFLSEPKVNGIGVYGKNAISSTMFFSEPFIKME